MNFEVEKTYSRSDVKDVSGLPRNAKGGNWDTGLVEHNGEVIIFANVGTEGRTGHNYNNEWLSEGLRWFHKERSMLSWQSVQELIKPTKKIHIFWRSLNTDPFTYAGLAHPVFVKDSSPVEFLWKFNVQELQEPIYVYPTEDLAGTYSEGRLENLWTTRKERDWGARQRCVQIHGLSCVVCGFNFEETYGDLGIGFIHVHHLELVASKTGEHSVDPGEDLCPVCPNCHAMLHRRNPPFTIEDLKFRLR